MRYFFFALLGICALKTQADTGWEAATRVEIGSYAETSVITGSSFTGTAFASASKKRPAGLYFNNTSKAIWIGTTTASIQTNHSNFGLGFPVASSSTFSLGGAFTGVLAFTCDPVSSTCEVRTLEGLVR